MVCTEPGRLARDESNGLKAHNGWWVLERNKEKGGYGCRAHSDLQPPAVT